MTCIGWLPVAAGLVRLLFARRTSSAHPRHDWFGRHFACGRLAGRPGTGGGRSEEHTSELQSLRHLVCRLLLEKKKLLLQCYHAMRRTVANPTTTPIAALP